MSNPSISPHTATHPPVQRGDETELYEAWAPRLLRSVASCVNTSDANVQDACSIAWMQLLRCQPRRETALAWLITVAKREAIRLDRADRARDSDGLEVDWMPDPRSIAVGREVLADTLAMVERLHPRRRAMLMEHASGYTFVEIAARHGVTRARARTLVYKARLQLTDMADDPDA
jgi:DNA-directed RNA polymerase specialized sigma24 family protein